MRPDFLSFLFDLYASKDAVYIQLFAEILITESQSQSRKRSLEPPF